MTLQFALILTQQHNSAKHTHTITIFSKLSLIKHLIACILNTPKSAENIVYCERLKWLYQV